MQNEFPFVTIITPAYNRASFLDETIQSVLSQDYPSFEYIVLDDGSTDHTQHVLKKYEERIRWESHPNMGETRTVNKGFALANGEILCVVNSDDPLLPGAISAAVAVMQEHPEALAAYPDWNEIGPASEWIQTMKLPDYTLSNMLIDFNVSIGPGTFFRRSVFDVVGMRNPQLKYTGDLEFWFRLALHGSLVHIPQVFATHRTHPHAASSTDKGFQMPDEVVQLVYRTYASPKLPDQLRPLRRQVFGMAHYTATFYCGANRRAMLTHYVTAFWYSPMLIWNVMLKYLHQQIGRLFWMIRNVFKKTRRFFRKAAYKLSHLR